MEPSITPGLAKLPRHLVKQHVTQQLKAGPRHKTMDFTNLADVKFPKGELRCAPMV